MNRRETLVIAGVLICLLAVTGGYFVWRANRDAGPPPANDEANNPPTASFKTTVGEDQPHTLRFDATGSRDPDGSVEKLAWDFGDGQTAEGPLVTHTFPDDDGYLVTLTVTDDGGGTHRVSRDVISPPAPTPREWKSIAAAKDIPLLAGEIEPVDEGVVRPPEAWIRWNVEQAGGRVLWRKVGEENVRIAPAAGAPLLVARLTELEPGARYEYVAEQMNGDYVQRSSIRTFRVEDGVAFDAAETRQTIERDYDQTVTLTLKNNTATPVQVAGKALSRFDDLMADIVGPGSVDEPVELPPGGDLKLRLAVFAQDATQDSYEIPVEAAGAVATAKISVAKPTFDLQIRTVGEPNPHTLAQTIEVINNGQTLSNFAVRVAAPHEHDVRLAPVASHALLLAGETMQFVASPVLFLEFESLQAELEFAAAGNSARFPMEFKPPAGARLIGVRTGTQGRGSSHDSYCTNRPNTCGDLPGAEGTGAEAGVSPVEPAVEGHCTPDGDCPEKGPPCNDPMGTAGLPQGFSRGPFGNADEAAKDALTYLIPKSNEHKVEFGGSIFRGPDGHYWVLCCEGAEGCVRRSDSPDWSSKEDRDSFHTHPPGGGNPESYSSEDLSARQFGHNEYLGKASGKMERRSVSQGKKGNDGKTILSPDWTGDVKDLGQTSPSGEVDLSPMRPEKPPPGSKPFRNSAGKPIGFTNGPCPTFGDKKAQQKSPGLSVGQLQRPGLLDALSRRAAFTREHRGPLAHPTEGTGDDSSDVAAGWHAGNRVLFAWHWKRPETPDGGPSDPATHIMVAQFTPLGEVVRDPEILGVGRWPRITADAERISVAWQDGEALVLRVNEQDKWGDPVPLTGNEAAIAFAPAGPLLAASSTGLWRLENNAFQPVEEKALIQPALAIDKDGQPRVASNQDGRIVVDGTVVGDGERPSLAIAPDGTLHVAYSAGNEIVVQARQEGGWKEVRRVSAQAAAWPALSSDKEGVRLTYFGPAVKGPEAMWLIRPSAPEPVLVPSLAGNVTDAWFLLKFGLKNPRSNYRPHNVLVSLNGTTLHQFENTVPQGRYLYRVNPYRVFASSGRPAWNRVAIRSEHLNGGSYSTSGDYQLITRTAWSEQFAFASTADEARQAAESNPQLNHHQPDLAVLANTLDLPVAPPTESIDFPVTIANLGEGDTRPARLAMLSGTKQLAVTPVPALPPGQETVVNLRVTGTLERVKFKIEYDDPEYRDFDATNDDLQMELWSKESYAIARASQPGAAPDAPPTAVAVNVRLLNRTTETATLLNDPEPPYRWTFLNADDDRVVATVEWGRMEGTLPAGRYRRSLQQYQFEGNAVVFPEVIDYKVEGKLPLSVQSGIRLDRAEATGPLHTWQVTKAGQPDAVIQWHRGEHATMLLPPGEYQVALTPVQFHTKSLIWPELVTVKPGEQTTLQMDSAIQLDWPVQSGPLYYWEVAPADKPGESLQWQRGEDRTMLLPPGKYQVTVTPIQFHSRVLVWPEPVVVKPGGPTTVRMDSTIALDWPEPSGPLHTWEVARADKPTEALQWQHGDQRTMLLPPGKYQVSVTPIQFRSKLLVWPEPVVVKPGERTTVRMDSTLDLDWPEHSGPLYSWEVTPVDKPGESLQSQRGDGRTMLLPPGKYQLSVTPIQFNSKLLVWPEPAVVKPGERTAVRMDSTIELKWPESAGPLYSWEVMPADKPEEALQSQRGDERTMLVPPGEYQVAVTPVQFYSERLVWPTKLTAALGQRAAAAFDSGIRLIGPDGVEPDFQFEILGAEGKVVQHGKQTWAAQVLPPGTYAVQVRRDSNTAWQMLAENVVVEPGRFANVKLAAIPAKDAKAAPTGAGTPR